jgi:hypothetical protein
LRLFLYFRFSRHRYYLYTKERGPKPPILTPFAY